MRNIKLIIEYDGTKYSGWQKQNNALTIQEVIENAIVSITNENINLIGSSRTDAGVHAKGFTANFITESKIPAQKFREAINSKLPNDIVILKSEEVDINFHSRYHSTGKIYVYTIINRYEPIAIGRDYVYHYKNKLDIELMKMASKYFIGKHDFTSFMKKGSSVKTTVRTITRLDVQKENDKLTITVSADGFLYNMVRIIVGTLIDVGIGKIKPEEIRDILYSKDRIKAGGCAPACGLCLVEVLY